MSRSKTARKVSEATGALSHTRIRLSRQSLKSFPSIDIKAATSVSALQDSGKSPGGKWLDQERDHVQAYEYLCHCSEAQQWMERCIGEPLGGDDDTPGSLIPAVTAIPKAGKPAPDGDPAPA